MSEQRTGPDNDLAAEYALGVLEGDALARARSLAERDPSFRAEVARWTGRLAPLLEDVEPAAPPQDVWSRIEARIEDGTGSGNIVALRRRVTLWRGIAGASSAIAAGLAVLLLAGPQQAPAPVAPTQVPAAPPLVAMLGSDQETKLVATWDPSGRRLILAVAGEMASDPAHSHELWVIPAGGKPHSLGTMADRPQMHMRLAETIATLMRQGATIAISVEPRGGSPTGQPTGEVIAAGPLHST